MVVRCDNGAACIPDALQGASAYYICTADWTKVGTRVQIWTQNPGHELLHAIFADATAYIAIYELRP
jgi:hypothetical protein